MRKTLFSVTGSAVLVAACAVSTPKLQDTGDAGGGPPDFGDASSSDADSCNLADMLVVLDRTMSMGYTPDGILPADTPEGHAASKWKMACDAVKGVTAPPTDQTVRFGLEIFPVDPHDIDPTAAESCVTLGTLLAKEGNPTNPACEPGELLVSPGVGSGAAIASWLDPEVLPLCVSTPIASALQTAATSLTPTKDHKQVVVLVTDGGETCAGQPKDWALSADVLAVQQLAQAGIQTYVIGFGVSGDGGRPDGGGLVGNDMFGVNTELLNDLACAGMTAPDFAKACKQQGLGYVAADAKAGPQIFTLVGDGDALRAAVQGVASGICCGCVK